MKRFYLISQNKSFKQEIEGGFIWCPQTKKDGSFCQNYEFVKNIKIGDIIFSRYKNQLPYIGIATSNCFISDNPFNDVSWNKEGYQVDIKYLKTNCTKRLADYFKEYESLLPLKFSPFTKKGGSVQAYAFELNEALSNYFITNFILNGTFLINSLESGFVYPEIISDEDLEKTHKIEQHYGITHKKAFKVDVEKETEQMKRNKELGDAGEQFIIHELMKDLGDLDDAIKKQLVIHAANDSKYGADSAGFDIIKFDSVTNSESREYIEVKTTNKDLKQPFFISSTELNFARQNPENYYIYRVYNFSENPEYVRIKFNDISQDEISPVNYKIELK